MGVQLMPTAATARTIEMDRREDIATARGDLAAIAALNGADNQHTFSGCLRPLESVRAAAAERAGA